MAVFVEVRRRLQSALLIFGEPEGGSLPLDISVTPASLSLRTPEGCTEIRLPAEVRLAPSSCGGLQYVTGEGLHLRLQAQVETSPQPMSVFNQHSPAQECCTFYCQSCGEVVIRDRKLLRVLPLPSENWDALVGEWCCHPDPFANKPLHPRENDCFIGDSFFLVNLQSNLGQEPKANTKVICKRCKVMLGEIISSETTKFYMTEIIIQPSERSFPIIPRSQFVQSVITQCLVELSSARSTFRFTIQGQDGKVYILLWILNSDSFVIESLRSCKCVKKFPLLEDTLEADASSAWSAIKVLYLPCVKSRNEQLASSWESDLSVHCLTLPSATCLELLLILSRSNASLPLSLRQMNSFRDIDTSYCTPTFLPSSVNLQHPVLLPLGFLPPPRMSACASPHSKSGLEKQLSALMEDTQGLVSLLLPAGLMAVVQSNNLCGLFEDVNVGAKDSSPAQSMVMVGGIANSQSPAQSF